MGYNIVLKRVYQEIETNDGFRLLADRLWPRGFKKDSLNLDLWLPKICPSNALRKKWHDQVLTFDEFSQQYREELSEVEEDLLPLLIAARKGRLTLLSAVKNLEESHLSILKNKVLDLLRQEDRLDKGNEQTSSPCYMNEFNSW